MDNREAAKKAKSLVDELLTVEGWTAAKLASHLNMELDETFYSAGGKLYMQQEPDHLPPVHIVTCG